MRTYLATLLLPLALVVLPAPLAAEPAPVRSGLPPKLSQYPKATPLKELPPKKQQAIKQALAKVSGLGAVAKKYEEFVERSRQHVELELARREAGVDVLNGVK